MTLPLETNENRAWWDGTKEKQLLLQQCRACDHIQHYPRAFCLVCGREDLGFIQSAGIGTVYSFSTVHHSPDPERFPPPYVVALVRLKEGPVLFTRLVDIDEPQCEMPVTVRWWPLPDGRRLPVFTA